MRALRCLSILLGVLAVGMPATSAWGYSFTMFDPTVYDGDTAAMDEALGITGYNIEDFEDSTLISGLSETHSGGSNFPHSTSIAWDGTNVFESVNVGGFVTFEIAGGATSFGIGFSHVNFSTQTLQINGGSATNYGALSGFVASGLRNGYLRIDAEGGDPLIDSITLNIVSGEITTFYDHLAFQTASAAVPEPSSLLLLGTGLVGLAGIARKRKAERR